jgi:hypothetical protein
MSRKNVAETEVEVRGEGLAEGIAEVIEAEKPAAAKRPKKLAKSIEGSIVTIVEAMTGEKMEFDFSKLPEAIQTKFGPFGLGHKLGDSAAGESGADAVAAIKGTWEGLMKGEWSTRTPKAEKLSKSEILGKVDAIEDPVKKQEMLDLLASLGIKPTVKE